MRGCVFCYARAHRPRRDRHVNKQVQRHLIFFFLKEGKRSGVRSQEKVLKARQTQEGKLCLSWDMENE